MFSFFCLVYFLSLFTYLLWINLRLNILPISHIQTALCWQVCSYVLHRHQYGCSLLTGMFICLTSSSMWLLFADKYVHMSYIVINVAALCWQVCSYVLHRHQCGCSLLTGMFICLTSSSMWLLFANRYVHMSYIVINVAALCGQVCSYVVHRHQCGCSLLTGMFICLTSSSMWLLFADRYVHMSYIVINMAALCWQVCSYVLHRHQCGCSLLTGMFICLTLSSMWLLFADKYVHVSYIVINVAALCW